MTLKQLIHSLIELSHNNTNTPKKEIVVKFPNCDESKYYSLEILELDDEIILSVESE